MDPTVEVEQVLLMTMVMETKSYTFDLTNIFFLSFSFAFFVITFDIDIREDYHFKSYNILLLDYHTLY